MSKTVYESCLDFKKKYPKTIAWRISKHAKIIDDLLDDNEIVLFSFLGQKDSNLLNPFYTVAVAFTNKRMLIGRKRFFGRYNYSCITPDMLNDFELKANLLFGMVEIDTIKEHFIINCIDKKALIKIEDALSKYLVEEKLKMIKNMKGKNN